jgi:2-dehydropantoate 2-reductase
MGQADIILLCVKSGAVRDGLLLAAKVAAPDGIVVTLQNGIGHLPLLQCLALPTVLGVTSLGATLTAPGHVRYAGRGPTRLGFATPPQPGVVILVACLAELLCRADIEVVVVDHILEYVWAKLFVNVGINALTAITNCTNGELLATARTRTQLIQAVGEAVAVARASGISVAQDPVEATMEVCRATRHNISSMLQDVRNRKPTEIEAINGAVVREGRRLHVETPVNEELVRSIKAIERAYAT